MIFLEITFIWVPLFGTIVSILSFTVSCLREMPHPGSDTECLKGCRPPMLVPQYGNNTGWRCGVCGTRWRIAMDLSKPREHYRQWVPQ